ncbi:MAG: hypothetical protein AVDCRST_MAG30-1726 [uncultured Solirubrobacteraceae bacterium]|uniref:Conserved hypothetical protein CHP03032 domain-containing protein n=1 Tax=uncultured Solirubrobacteraceae bacterium TaxID=1162706 RepID=A0A6J4SM98_9ACTN|nr:MAG: hypothetical protein AVDCRST_MAG30-1726 [uncultured Solirubrobacteraceae bacterium]
MGPYDHPPVPPPVAPVFLVGPPLAGDGTLLASLAHASGVWHARTAARSFLDAVPEADPAARGYESHRLTASDAPALAAAARAALQAALVDREGRAPDQETGPVVPVAGGSRLGLCVPFLAAIFPGARFVLAERDGREAVPELLTAWRGNRLVTVAELPGWTGPWSGPLVPGWRELAGAPLESVAAEQWRIADTLVREDLGALDADRWVAADHARLIADPRAELRRLCEWLGVPYDQALLSPFEEVRRSRRSAAPAPAPAPAASSPEPASPFASASTASFPQRLGALGSSLLISTYQTGKLVCARERDGALNTHFRDFDKPMGMALADGRLCLGTRTEVWDLRDMPEVAARLAPPGTHDACYLPRNRHVTGDIAVHEMAFAEGELWLVATAFSCLATLDAHHSFVPRWTPPFISALAPGDRCHLNGMAVVDDRVRYVTALGTTDEPGTWRERKADGGVLLDVPSSETVVAGLSMPHSPRWHDGRLWVLESGRGELCLVDLERGRTETVAELPGFTRGLAFAGTTAFVGLSQIRESSTFGDLPLTRRLQERMSGVWMVDLTRGAIDGFLRFDDLVQEVFDVALLAGKRWPEVADTHSSAVATSYVLP